MVCDQRFAAAGTVATPGSAGHSGAADLRAGAGRDRICIGAVTRNSRARRRVLAAETLLSIRTVSRGEGDIGQRLDRRPEDRLLLLVEHQRRERIAVAGRDYEEGTAEFGILVEPDLTGHVLEQQRPLFGFVEGLFVIHFL